MIGELLVANTPKATNPTDAVVAQAILRNTRVTPQKARRVVNLIRGERADVALTTLKFAPQEVGTDLYTLLNSAINNAKQKSPTLRDASELYVVEALVDEAPTLKRFRPRAQGRGFNAGSTAGAAWSCVRLKRGGMLLARACPRPRSTA